MSYAYGAIFSEIDLWQQGVHDVTISVCTLLTLVGIPGRLHINMLHKCWPNLMIRFWVVLQWYGLLKSIFTDMIASNHRDNWPSKQYYGFLHPLPHHQTWNLTDVFFFLGGGGGGGGKGGLHMYLFHISFQQLDTCNYAIN